jgi:hypothetical protein
VEIKEYQVKISNRFAALENLNGNDMGINRDRESIRVNKNVSHTDSLNNGLKNSAQN